MSRRNRDYSILGEEERGFRYHRTFDTATSLSTRVIATAITSLIVACVGLAAEKAGDMYAQRGDKAEYDDASRAKAQDYVATLVAEGHLLIIDIGEPGAQDIPTLPPGIPRDEFGTIANASKPGGQSSDKASADPFRYDLEWPGMPNQSLTNIPSKYCIQLELPPETQAVMAWQNNDDNATLEIRFDEHDTPFAEACQYGKDDTIQHHEVAILASNALR